MDRDEAAMAGRLAVQVVAGALIARGVGDAAMWEAAAGLAAIVAGYTLSRRSRRRLRDRAARGDKAMEVAREMVGRR